MNGHEDGQKDDEEFIDTLRTQLRASETPDAATRARLSAARARALAATQPRIWQWGAAGMALAATLLAAVAIPRFLDAPALPQELLLDVMLDEALAEEVELAEDLDLLTWLASGDERA